MNRKFRRWGLALVAAFTVAGYSTPALFAQPTNPPAVLAQVEDLKSRAFSALRDGRFELTNDLLTQAKELSADPTLTQMHTWLAEFEGQRDRVNAEREKSYSKAEKNVHDLIDAGYQLYAYDSLANAYLYAADRDEFVNQPWVRDLINSAGRDADQAMTTENWIVARRLYMDLNVIEPVNPSWRKKFNDVTSRLRLLAVYTPDTLTKLYDAETDTVEKVRAIVEPDKAPTTRPAEDEKLDDSFKISWEKTLEGVDVEMLRDALADARRAYWRDASVEELLNGGIDGVRAIATTKGLEATFPNLNNPEKKKMFLAALDEVSSATANLDENRRIDAAITALLEVNRLTLNLPEEVVVTEFANGSFATLDPFSVIIWPYNLLEFQKDTQGKFIGVGIQINQDEEGFLKVVTPFEDTPAYRAGIKPGDVITHINGKYAKGVNISQAINNITGPRGTEVVLTIRDPQGVSRDLTIKRDLIKVPSIRGWAHRAGGGWDYLIDDEQGIAYVRMTSFTPDTGSELNSAVSELRKEGMKAIILDLRYNPGGVLQAATAVVDKFLADGVIVSRRGERDITPVPPTEARKSSDDVLDTPMIVLVNQISASASEIVSGALKDHSRALIVGERTFGKGSVQELIPLTDRSAYLKLTTSHYYLPSGRCLHREDDSLTWGVEPDVVVPMTPEQMRDSNEARQQLDVLRELSEDSPDYAAKQKEAESALLENDPQLSTALLLLRMRLAGAPVM